MQQIFYDPTTMQVMAVYKGCKTGNPEVWTDQGFKEITVKDTLRVTRNHKIKEIALDQITLIEASDNPIQPRKSVDEIEAKINAIARKIGLTKEEIEAEGFKLNQG